MTPLLLAASLATAPAFVPTLGLSAVAPASPEEGDVESKKSDEEYGPFFEEEAVSDTAFNTQPRRGKKTPILSVGNGAFCFVDGSACKVSLVLSASVGVGMRVPASDAGPDLPYSQFMFRGGLVTRPMMWTRRAWHPWGLGVVGSWSRGTGSVTQSGSAAEENPEVQTTDHTDAWRVGLYNQIWLSKKAYGLHLDLTLGTVRSDILTSGTALYGTHAELAFGWGGWGGLFASGDFLDRDTRIVFGFRGHGIAAGPIVALALAGLAMGGAL